jgi:large subunit ribosomal protein L30|tara:strand:- start:472 stop:651 length:180 start_codon:yes stop_codon:yes gene_type:complete
VSKLKLTWKKSSIGYNKSQKLTVRALGLKKLNQSVEHEDNPAIRGMIKKVQHLIIVQEL